MPTPQTACRSQDNIVGRRWGRVKFLRVSRLRLGRHIIQDVAKFYVVWPAKALPQTLDSNLYDNATAAPRWKRDGVVYRAFAAYQKAGGETQSRCAAPQLVGPADVHLQRSSRAIDAGAEQNGVAVDNEGVTRPQGAACDFGAYEFKVNTK